MRDAAHAGALGELSRFRQEFSRCLPARGDALFEVAEAVLCADGPVTSLAELSLAVRIHPDQLVINRPWVWPDR